MKVKDFFPELPSLAKEYQRVNDLANFMEISKAGSGSDVYRSQSLGIDQLVNSWLRQQMAYRYQLMMDLRTIAMTVEEIRGPLNHITSEVFRRGIQWKAKFAMKCNDCGTEYNESVKECEDCKSQNLRKPDNGQKKQFDAFRQDCNIFDQSLEEVLRAMHFDINCFDDGFLYLSKEYIGLSDGTVRSKPIEVRKLDPALIELDLDGAGLPKNRHFVCYLHRDETASSEEGKCSECGRNLIPAMYIYNHRGGKYYLLDTEVIHVSKFSPSETYGWSPIMTIFEKAITLIGMDKNMYRYFFERKMPMSMLMVSTDDPDSLKRERAYIEAQVRANPNFTPIVAVSNKTNRGRVDLVRLFHTLQEMDYLPVRSEIKERISEMWGVQPIWQSSVESLGGLASQSQQLTVMSRVVEGDQRLFKEKVFPVLLESFGITDWELDLPVPEEIAQQTRLAFAQQRVGIASQLKQMGYKVTPKSPEMGLDNIDFVVSGEATDPNAQAGGAGGLGGMFGGIASGGPPPEGNSPQELQPSSIEPPTGIQAMSSGTTWLEQIQNAGFKDATLDKVSTDGSKIKFISNGTSYIASFENGKLSNVEKVQIPIMKRPIVTSKEDDVKVTMLNDDEE